MSAISGYINQIQTAVYGEQVRSSIVNALLACYSDVENPDLQSAAFQAAIEAAYQDGILDIITVTSFNDMTNQNIIYRYNGTAAGKQKGLYYYSALSSSWVLIGSEIQKVSLASQMTDVNDIYKYIGTESGMVQNSLYCHNGTSWVPIGSGVLTASTAAQMTNTDAIYKYTGNESGYISNALYYYNGTNWAPISPPVTTDATLTAQGRPADAKAVGDALATIDETVSDIQDDVADITGNLHNLPILDITGDLSLMTAEKNEVQYSYTWSDGHVVKSGWLKAKKQGQSTLTLPKNNYTIKLYSDASATRKDSVTFFDELGSGNKWVIKANYNDFSQSRNIVSARIWGNMVSTRDVAPPQTIAATKNYAATNGFPFLLYNNGSFWGLYEMIIPKDLMLGMDEDNPLHCAMQGEAYNMGDTTKVLATEFRKVSTDGWNVEFPDTLSQSVQTGFLAMISFVKDSTDENFVAHLNDYIDVESAIDYYLFAYFAGAYDSLARNLMMLTYDGGTKWYCSYWDMDSTFGNNYNGTEFLSPTIPCPENYLSNNSLLWQRMEELFAQELYDRYENLRTTVFALNSINTRFKNFIDAIGSANYAREANRWPLTPHKDVDSYTQITTWIAQRANYVDGEIYGLVHEVIPCTGITLNKNSITFEFSTPQTLVATPTPSTTTDTVIWASSNTSVATVSQDGVVTPVSIGSSTITVTCGNYSATCSVVVTSTQTGITWLDSPIYYINDSGNLQSGVAYASELANFANGQLLYVGNENYEQPRIAQYKASDNTCIGVKTWSNPTYFPCFPFNKYRFNIHPVAEQYNNPNDGISFISNIEYIACNKGLTLNGQFNGAENMPTQVSGQFVYKLHPVQNTGFSTFTIERLSSNWLIFGFTQYASNGQFLQMNEISKSQNSSATEVTASVLANCAYIVPYLYLANGSSMDTLTQQTELGQLFTYSST